mmetsp:Transcript_80527/g.260878  ORF Transcript_80527/g.260878 Transcript_80527/m.260878 type:complete len:585 (-) Transcript_80527:350-2104(-)
MSKRGAGEISQSVEDSNKLREKLGIKPLKEAAKGTKGTSNDPEHVAPVLGRTPVPEDPKQKQAAKKAKDAHKELTTGKGLGDILAEEEGKGGAADWVNRTRNKDGSMKAASSAPAVPASSSSKKAALESVPKIKVRHDASGIGEGESVIMTLSDQRLLDKDGNLIDEPDELSNVRMSDAERAKHNEALRKQVDYDPTKQNQDILDKYDELNTAPAGFVVGGRAVGGAIDESDPEKKLAILTALGEKHTLEAKLKLQSDYYTADEMEAKFRKPPKRKAKRRKTEKVDKDDAIGDAATVGMGGRPQDCGSDEEDPELYEQLSKQRRLVKKSADGTMRKGEAALVAVTEQIAELNNEDDEKKDEKDKVILGSKGKDGADIAMTATTEFCNVVQTPIEKLDTIKHEAFRGSTLYKQQATQRKGIAAGERRARKAGQAAPTPDELAAAERGEEDIKDLQEHDLDLSVASGLAYLRARAQIGNDQESHKFKKSDNRPLEMSTLDGDIKLEYRDDFGRVQTPKEAFRAISWKFHGKTPGRKNMERRLLRLENEMRLKTMDPMSALPTLRALRHVQAVEAKPFMVLSGANEK